MSEKSQASPGPQAEDIPVEYLDIASASENDALTESVDIEDDRDLTGGSLGMLEDAASDLNLRNEDVNIDEIAYDIRPNKLQPRNEMVRS
jgi:hypothetical protein